MRGVRLVIRVTRVVDGLAVTAAPRVKTTGQVWVGRLGVHGDEAPGDAVEDAGTLHAAVELVSHGAHGDSGGGDVGAARDEAGCVDLGRGVAEVGDGGRGIGASN